MALEMDLERKPSPDEWLAQDAWFDDLVRSVYQAFRDGYQEASGMAKRRFTAQQPATQSAPRRR